MVKHLEKVTGEVKRLSEVGLRTLAKNIYTERVFFALGKEDFEYAFGGFYAMVGEKFSPEFVASTGGAWEYMEKAGPMLLNGRPIFLSAHFIHKEDVPLMIEQLKKITAIMGEL